MTGLDQFRPRLKLKSFLLGGLCGAVAATGLMCGNHVVALSGGVVRSLGASSDSDFNPLTDLGGVWPNVHLEFVENNDNQASYTYRNTLRRQLDDHGIDVLHDNELTLRYQTDQPAPHLTVRVWAERVPPEKETPEGGKEQSMIIYASTVTATESTMRKRSPKVPDVDGVLWSCTDIGVLPGNATNDELVETAESCVEKFIQAYDRAN